MAVFLLMGVMFLSSCVPTAPAREEHPSRIVDRLLRARFAETWAAAKRVVEEDKLRVTGEDETEGVLTSRVVHRFRARDKDFGKELLRIADLEEARRRGMRSVGEYSVDYQIRVARLDDEESRLTVAAKIVAVDRSEVVYLGFGGLHVIPRYFELRSKGALEHDLARRIESELFAGEEMLYYTGELGRE